VLCVVCAVCVCVCEKLVCVCAVCCVCCVCVGCVYYAQKLENQVAVLEAARQEIEKSSRAKSLFMANMSHELRTPINAIIGFNEMLAEDAEEAGNTQALDYLNDIKISAERLLEFVSNVLDMSKIEAEKIVLTHVDFDIYELVADVVSAIKPLVAKNNNVLQFECAQTIGTLKSDNGKIRQSLINLLGNACKFTKNGIIRLTVNKVFLEEIDYIEFSVEDNGIGIPDDQIDKLFDSFSQVESSEARRFEGSGLGLAISQRFCKLLGGKITVNSTIGKGSTFSMYIPLNPVNKLNESVNLN